MATTDAYGKTFNIFPYHGLSDATAKTLEWADPTVVVSIPLERNPYQTPVQLSVINPKTGHSRRKPGALKVKNRKYPGHSSGRFDVADDVGHLPLMTVDVLGFTDGSYIGTEAEQYFTPGLGLRVSSPGLYDGEMTEVGQVIGRKLAHYATMVAAKQDFVVLPSAKREQGIGGTYLFSISKGKAGIPTRDQMAGILENAAALAVHAYFRGEPIGNEDTELIMQRGQPLKPKITRER